jgi:cytochrome b561
MANNESLAGSSTSTRGSADGRPSEETLVAKPDAGPLPKKQGEFGWIEGLEPQQDATISDDDLPARHPADRSSPTPGPAAPSAPGLPPAEANASSSSLQSQSSVFKQFLRTPRPLPKIHGIRASTVLRVALIVATLIASIVGWAVTVTRMNAWNARNAYTPPTESDPSSPEGSTTPAAPQMSQMAGSSLVFVHVAFGAAILFQLLMLERSVYRFRAERYAFLHPEEMAASVAASGGSAMGLAPWNRPPLPTYAAALGVRGTGDVEVRRKSCFVRGWCTHRLGCL